MIQTNLDAQIAAIALEVGNDTTVDGSALKLIQSIPGLIAAAVATALTKGATPAQLQSLSDLQDTLAKNDTVLAAAVSAGTSSAPVSPTANIVALAGLIQTWNTANGGLNEVDQGTLGDINTAAAALVTQSQGVDAGNVDATPTVKTNIVALNTMIVAFDNTPGALGAADQTSLTNIRTASASLVTQVGG
jgi:hypothetical protein